MSRWVRVCSSVRRGVGPRIAAFSCIAAGVFACDAPPPASTEPQERRAEPTAPAGQSGPDDLAAPRPKKAAVIGGEEVARAVQWPEPDAVDGALRDRLPAASLRSVEDAALPVLVPAEGTERGHLTVGDRWYAFSTRVGETTINVQGSARARVHNGIGRADPMHVVRGQGAFVSQNEGIWVVSWIERGVAYSIDLECDDPRAQTCDGPARAVALAEGLGLVGGRGVQ